MFISDRLGPRDSLIRRARDCVGSHGANGFGPRWTNSTGTAMHQLRAENQAPYSLLFRSLCANSTDFGVPVLHGLNFPFMVLLYPF